MSTRIGKVEHPAAVAGPGRVATTTFCVGGNPYDRQWVVGVLGSMAVRAQAGETPELLRTELVHLLWPWINSTADRLVRRLPPGVDGDDLRSQVIWEMFQAVLRMDWDRYGQWPALLKARVRGAFTACARDDDVLTRGQRHARNVYLKNEDDLAQLLGRTLSTAEKRDLAVAVAPRGGVTAVLYGSPRALPLVASFEGVDSSPGPEELVTSRFQAAAVRMWLTFDVPRDLAQNLDSWQQSDAGVLSGALQRRTRPYLPALLARLENREP